MTLARIAELEQLARAATPGPWQARGGTHSVIINGAGEGRDAVVATARDYGDVDFIAAANPAVVLELVQRLRAAEAIVRDLAARPVRFGVGINSYSCLVECCTVALPESLAERAKVGRLVHAADCVHRRAVEAEL